MSKLATALHNVTRLPIKQTAEVVMRVGEMNQFKFTNPNGETYVLRRNENGGYVLGYPEEDYTGDPQVVEFFNRYMSSIADVNRR